MSDKPRSPMYRVAQGVFGCLGLWAVLVIAWLLFMVVRGVTPTGAQTEIATEVLGKLALGAVLVWQSILGVRRFIEWRKQKAQAAAMPKAGNQ